MTDIESILRDFVAKENQGTGASLKTLFAVLPKGATKGKKLSEALLAAAKEEGWEHRISNSLDWKTDKNAKKYEKLKNAIQSSHSLKHLFSEENSNTWAGRLDMTSDVTIIDDKYMVARNYYSDC